MSDSTPRPALEIVAQDSAGARVAIDAGADRIELCQALSTGGMTPSLGILESVIAAVGGPRVAVLVRPRGGGFVYTPEEIAVVASDVRAAVAHGAGAVVVGALTRDGAVDVEALSRWRDAAADADVVFHRAIDVAPDPLAALDALIEHDIARVLTSGGAVSSLEGVDVLSRMVRHVDGALQIQAGGGVTIDAIPALVSAGVDAVHLSARTMSADDAPSGPGGGSPGFEVTSGEIVRAAAQALGR